MIVSLRHRLFMDYVKRNEGYSRKMYLDSKGIPTIGIGHNLNIPIPDEAIQIIFKADIKKVLNGIKSHPRLRKIFESSNLARQMVLVDMAFNLGFQGLLKFEKMLTALEQKYYEKAAHEILDSHYAEQVQERAKRNALMMKTGDINIALNYLL